LNFPRLASVCDAPVVGLSDADGAGIAPEETVSLAAGEVDAVDFGIAPGVVRGGGVALGTSNRLRRCDVVGKGDAKDTGVEVAAGVGGGSDGITLPGVIFVSGVDVAAAVGASVADIVADGNGVAVTGVDEAGVSAP
jgi:hypothetical protein